MLRQAWPKTPPLAGVLGLVLLLGLASLLFSLRGVVMLSQAALPSQLCQTAPEHPPAKPQAHLEHCPICLLQMMLPTLAPALGLGQPVAHAERLWLGEPRAKGAFVQAVWARGPPASPSF
ncbi:hypothetical protein [Meiothermus rufus]|uniref:hypothetical protein n=1 Tax=Meiothermus rufus TaxID=604332 RepID=UPI0003F4ECB9|nr:hypothetical protein [Meiothermus rufus]